jgi:hypothetical protein
MTALAKPVCLSCGSTLLPNFGGTVSPKQMPKHEYVPVVASIFGKIKTSDGTHPSALREVDVNIDKDVKINAGGLPSCKCWSAMRDMRDPGAVRRACTGAILGGGNAHVEMAFPELPPIKVASPITVFNGGEKDGKVTLLIHVFIAVPVPAAIVTQVTIQRKGSGLHSIAKVPVIAGGSGSMLDFQFKLGRTYAYKHKRIGFIEARCPDGKFKASMPRILFKNETKIAGIAPTTTLKGSLSVPCTPQG